MTVFVDSSAFVPLANPDDQDHDDATRVAERLLRERSHLVTHEYVIVETFALLQRGLGLPAAGRFVDVVLPLVEQVWVDQQLHREARAAALSGARGISLVDWTSFIVMRRLGITTAFAFDADFATQGFAVIPAPAA